MSDRVLLITLVVTLCLAGSGIAQASSLEIKFHGSMIEIVADRVPLVEILKAISLETGVRVESNDPMSEPVSCRIRKTTFEQGIRRLLKNRNHALIYSEVDVDRFAPAELRILGKGPLWSLGGIPPEPPADLTAPDGDSPSADDPIKKYHKAWFQKEFGDKKKLIGEISVRPAADGVDEQGIVITRLSEISALRKLGLKQNDTVMDVNGRPVSTSKEFIQALQSLPDGNPSIIMIQRSNSEHLIDPIYIELH